MIHEHLKRIRVHCKVTQQQLADYLNVSPQSISKWEKGEAYPSVEYLPKMAEFFHCGVNAFFSEYELGLFERFEGIDNDTLLHLLLSNLNMQGEVTVASQAEEDVEEDFYNTLPMEALFLPALYEYLRKNEKLTMSGLQKELKIGYALAGRIVEALTRMGVVDISRPTEGCKIIQEKVDLLIPYLQRK